MFLPGSAEYTNERPSGLKSILRSLLWRVRDLTSRLVFNRSYVNIATSDKRYLFSIRGDGDIRSSIGQKTMDHVVLDLIRDDLDIHLWQVSDLP